METHVLNLGSGLRPVVRTSAPGGMGSRINFSARGPSVNVRGISEMLIFARFYKGLYYDLLIIKTLRFHNFREIANNPPSITEYIAKTH